MKKGFTLIELIIYMGLLGILLTIMSEVFIGILNLKLASESNSQVVLDGNFIQTRLTYDVHRAERIIAPDIGQTGGVLTLAIVEEGVEQVYQYALVGDALTITRGSDSDVLSADDSRVTEFSVTRIGNSETLASAKDTLSFLYTVKSGRDELPFELSVGLR